MLNWQMNADQRELDSIRAKCDSGIDITNR